MKKQYVGRAYITANKKYNENPKLPVITGKITMDDGNVYWLDLYPSKKGSPDVFSGVVVVPVFDDED